MSHHLRANLQQLAKMVADGKAVCRLGVVSSYDPAHYAMKVKLQPTVVETGWMPVASIWVGNGWGLYAPPTVGDQAVVFFQEADLLTGLGGLSLYSDVDQPLRVESGEFWLVHKTGAFIKLTNDGKLSLQDAAETSLTFNNDGTATFKGTTFKIEADVEITGDTTISGDLSNDGQTSLSGGGPAIARVGDLVDGGVITSGSDNAQSG